MLDDLSSKANSTAVLGRHRLVGIVRSAVRAVAVIAPVYVAGRQSRRRIAWLCVTRLGDGAADDHTGTEGSQWIPPAVVVPAVTVAAIVVAAMPVIPAVSMAVPAPAVPRAMPVTMPAAVVDHLHVARLRHRNGWDGHGLRRRIAGESRHSREEQDPNLLHLHTYLFE